MGKPGISWQGKDHSDRWDTHIDCNQLFESTFISGVVRNQNFGKMKVIQQHSIGFDGIERGVSQKNT